MVDSELQRIEAQVVATGQALAEYEHVLDAQGRLRSALAAEEARVQHLTVELAREQNDVAVRSAGVRGFLYALLGDEQLSIEQREAIEAEARLAEATASRAHLAGQLAALDARLAGHSHRGLADAASDARAAKEAVLVKLHHPAGIALQDLSVRIQAIDIELIPLDDAVIAGEAAIRKLQAVISTLDRARIERVDQDDARGTAGEAQAATTVFQRAVDALVTAEEPTLGFTTLIADEDREPFVDRWIRALVGKGDRDARLTAARAAIASRLDRVNAQLMRVRARRDEVAPRRDRLVAERQQLLG